MRNHLFALALTLAAGFANAQGAPLLLPAKAQTPAQQNWLDAISRQEHVAKVTPVIVDANALNSNVISVTIEGKTHTFAGQREQTSRGHETWSSTGSKDGNAVSLLRGPLGVSGSIWIDHVSFAVEPGALIKNKPMTQPFTSADLSKFNTPAGPAVPGGPPAEVGDKK